jgi:hypothetical protein
MRYMRNIFRTQLSKSIQKVFVKEPDSWNQCIDLVDLPTSFVGFQCAREQIAGSRFAYWTFNTETLIPLTMACIAMTVFRPLPRLAIAEFAKYRNLTVALLNQHDHDFKLVIS